MLWVIYLAIVILVIAGLWKAFEKAGVPGWSAIVPIYNVYVMTKMANRPGWWVILTFIPLVNIVVLVIISMDIAPKYGQTAAFGVGMALLSFIFWPILGFGDAQWQEAPVTL
ncbi:MAG: signal peptidase I [bacterium]|nr:signal peptidase I [bacterium]